MSETSTLRRWTLAVLGLVFALSLTFGCGAGEEMEDGGEGGGEEQEMVEDNSEDLDDAGDVEDVEED